MAMRPLKAGAFFFQFGCSFTPCVISLFLQESLLEDNVHRL
jgi:hypothetical protein